MNLPVVTCLYLLHSFAVQSIHGERDASTSEETSADSGALNGRTLRDGVRRLVEADTRGNNDFMQHQEKTSVELDAFPFELEEMPLCVVQSNQTSKFQLGPWKSSLDYDGSSLTGSTWGQATDFWNQESITEKFGIKGKPTHFAWVNAKQFNDKFLDSYGGFVIKNENEEDSSKAFLGAVAVCDPDKASFCMKFEKPERVTQLPSTFSMGRMEHASLPKAIEGGAKRKTWVHVEEGFMLGLGKTLGNGGFLYQVIRDGQNELVFFERKPFGEQGTCTTSSTAESESGKSTANSDVNSAVESTAKSGAESGANTAAKNPAPGMQTITLHISVEGQGINSSKIQVVGNATK